LGITSRSDWARRAGVSIQLLGLILAGARTLTEDTRRALAVSAGVPETEVDDLLLSTSPELAEPKSKPEPKPTKPRDPRRCGVLRRALASVAASTAVKVEPEPEAEEIVEPVIVEPVDETIEPETSEEIQEPKPARVIPQGTVLAADEDFVGSPYLFGGHGRRRRAA
jgi:hypothetical protein